VLGFSIGDRQLQHECIVVGGLRHDNQRGPLYGSIECPRSWIGYHQSDFDNRRDKVRDCSCRHRRTGRSTHCHRGYCLPNAGFHHHCANRNVHCNRDGHRRFQLGGYMDGHRRNDYIEWSVHALRRWHWNLHRQLGTNWIHDRIRFREHRGHGPAAERHQDYSDRIALFYRRFANRNMFRDRAGHRRLQFRGHLDSYGRNHHASRRLYANGSRNGNLRCLLSPARVRERTGFGNYRDYGHCANCHRDRCYRNAALNNNRANFNLRRYCDRHRSLQLSGYMDSHRRNDYVRGSIHAFRRGHRDLHGPLRRNGVHKYIRFHEYRGYRRGAIDHECFAGLQPIQYYHHPNFNLYANRHRLGSLHEHRESDRESFRGRILECDNGRKLGYRGHLHTGEYGRGDSNDNGYLYAGRNQALRGNSRSYRIDRRTDMRRHESGR